MPELFIYYRIAQAQADESLHLVGHWQAALRERHPALQARLLKRPAAGDCSQPETWMETYAAPGADGLIEGLHDELAAGPPGAALERHVEVFVPCAS